MATYEYKAISETGRIAKGRIEAVNLLDLENRVKQMGLELIDGQPAKTGVLFKRKVGRRERIDFCFHMSQLTKAGVPLIEALEDFANSLDQGQMREVVATVIESIRGGKAFSEALEQHPFVFDGIFVALIQSGEHSGNLPIIFERLLHSLRWEDELRAKFIKVMLYPTFSLSIVLLVFLFFMLYLVPKLVTVLKQLVPKLPPQTEAMIAISEFLQKQWGLVLVMIGIFIVLSIMISRSKGPVRHYVDSAKMRLPLIGGIITKIILTRFTSLLAMLYASGITVTKALEICSATADNLVIREGIEDARRLISEGKSITESFTQAAVFPGLVIRMLRVGEQSGQIDHALENVSYFYNREVQEAIERVQELIQPILTILIGGMIGWLGISVLGPMYDVISKVQV